MFEEYQQKCRVALRRLGAPLDGWYCTGCYDVREKGLDYATCELCGHSKVRFIHMMENPNWPEALEVGCICAAAMEDDEFAAKERENDLKNWVNRRQSFISKEWNIARNGNPWIRAKGKMVFINPRGAGYSVYIPRQFGGGAYVERYRGEPILTIEEAKLAAFDLIDPPGRGI